MAKRLGIDFSATETESKPKTTKMSETDKQKAIQELSAEINRSMTKRMYSEHDLAMPK